MIKSSLFHLAFLFCLAALPLTTISATESSLIAKGGGGHGGGHGGWSGGGGHHGSGDWGHRGGDWGHSDWNRGGDWGGGNYFYLDTGYPSSRGGSYYNQSYYDPYYYNTNPGAGVYFEF